MTKDEIFTYELITIKIRLYPIYFKKSSVLDITHLYLLL